MTSMDTIDITKRNMRWYRQSRWVILVLISLGILSTLSGLFLHQIYTWQVEKHLVLTDGSEAYKNWMSPPSPVYMKYYVFNYTNVEDILEHRATPNISQIGPFIYREIRINQVLDYNEYNITYVQNYSFVFEPNMSCSTCKESNMVYVPNIAFLTVLRDIHEKVKDPGYFKIWVLNNFFRFINGASLFKKLTAGQVMWGYEDDLLKSLGHIEIILVSFGFRLPDMKVIALQHNGTENAKEIGNITILTGKENINDVQRIVRWRGLDNAPYWNTKYADMINGTDGSHAQPFVSRDKKWYVFVPPLCRSMYFEYQKDIIYDNIPMYRFTTTPKLFSGNISLNPDNIAFCNSTATCLDGLLPLSKCQVGGPPVYMSSPHFYEGDKRLVKRIRGMKPDPDLHGNFLDVEPITGLTMVAKKRLQINVMGRRSFVSLSSPLQYDVNFLPMLMIEEIAVIDHKSAAKFRKMVLVPKHVVTYAHYVLLILGISMITLGLVLSSKLVMHVKGNTEDVDIINEEDDSAKVNDTSDRINMHLIGHDENLKRRKTMSMTEERPEYGCFRNANGCKDVALPVCTTWSESSTSDMC